jgi:hypothetical protein
MGTTTQQLPTANCRKLKAWWNAMAKTWTHGAGEQEQKFIYTIWNIWKERCRPVYDNKAMTGSQLLQMIKLDVEQFAKAWGNLDNHDPA